MLTVGIEEEFFVIDPTTHRLAPDGLPGLPQLMARSPLADDGISGFDHEFHLSVIESRTGVCDSLEQVCADIEKLRGALDSTARDAELSVASVGTMPLLDWRTTRVMDKQRYREVAAHYGDVAQRRATCGCHVHIGIDSRELAVQVLNRVRPWLPTLLAISASSPYFGAADTGYDSYRRILWEGFPVVGIADVHESYADYKAHIALLIDVGATHDAGDIYWDARLGTNFETLEFRIADACTTVDETILQAGLCRALVSTCLRQIDTGEQVPIVRSGLLKAATWRAARSGLTDTLIDVIAEEKIPATEMVHRFLAFVRDGLTDSGDDAWVVDLVNQILSKGTSAQRQRDVMTRTGQLDQVVEHLIAETTRRA